MRIEVFKEMDRAMIAVLGAEQAEIFSHSVSAYGLQSTQDAGSRGGAEGPNQDV